MHEKLWKGKPTMTDARYGVNDVYSRLKALGYNIPDFTPDGVVHRFTRTKKNSGWYVAHTVPTDRGPFLIVVCGDWVTGEKHKITPDIQWSARDAEKIRISLERAYEEEGKRKQEKNDFAAEQAAELWELADPNLSSVYMERKGFRSNYGGRVNAEGTLLVPMVVDDKLWGLTQIFPDGKKLFLAGQRTKGTYFTIGAVTPKSTAYLCEGFATAVSIHEATGKPVIVAFSASNLIETAKHFHKHRLIIAADNDRFTEGNPGITEAQKVALSCGFPWVAPSFTVEGKLTDFNDLHMAEGLDAVRSQLQPKEQTNPVKEKKESKPNKTPAEVYAELAKKIDSALGRQFFVTANGPGSSKFFLERDRKSRTVCAVDKEQIVGALLVYLQQFHGVHKDYCLDPKDAEECVKYWKLTTPPMPLPKPYAFANDPSETFHRLPFDLVDNGKPTPTFDMILRRTGNMFQTIRYWIGSIFVEDSDRSTYLYWFGYGGDGKGSICQVMERVLGNAYLGTQTPQTDSERRFWSHRVLGKRLVAFPECKNYAFIMTSLFMSITGGDTINAEFKGKDGFSFTPQCFMMVCSNERSGFDGSQANLRRVLYAESSQRSKDDPVLPKPIMQARLWDEAPQFLARCVAEYLAKYPDKGPILMPDNSAEELAEVNEERWEALSHKYFIKSTSDSVHSGDWMEFRRLEKLGDQEYRNWREWLTRRWDIKPYRNNAVRGWKGMRKRTSTERGVFEVGIYL